MLSILKEHPLDYPDNRTLAGVPDGTLERARFVPKPESSKYHAAGCAVRCLCVSVMRRERGERDLVVAATAAATAPRPWGDSPVVYKCALAVYFFGLTV